MAKKGNKINNVEINTLQLIHENEISGTLLDAEASVMLNPYVRWAKFILTDDQPNGNGERVPVEEFDNLIQSGIHMPIKMAEGRIEEGHEFASPIGVITHLKKEFVDGINRIVGLAALWLRERPSDVSYLKERLDEGAQVNISWELGASDKVLADDGVYDWRGLAMQAATVVDRPAYQGRTQILAIASKNQPPKWSDLYIETLPDSAFLHVEDKGVEGRTPARYFPVRDDKGLYDVAMLGKVLTEAGKSNLPEAVLKSVTDTATTLLDRIAAGASLEEISAEKTEAPLENIVTEERTVELEQLQNRVAELEAKLATAESALAEATQKVASMEAMASEYQELKQFKTDFDAQVAKAEKLEAIKTKFAEAGLKKDETYFAENAEKLLNLDEAAFDFMLQELAAFASEKKQDGTASLSESTVPNFPSELADGEIDIAEIARALRERKSK